MLRGLFHLVLVRILHRVFQGLDHLVLVLLCCFQCLGQGRFICMRMCDLGGEFGGFLECPLQGCGLRLFQSIKFFARGALDGILKLVQSFLCVGWQCRFLVCSGFLKGLGSLLLSFLLRHIRSGLVIFCLGRFRNLRILVAQPFQALPCSLGGLPVLLLLFLLEFPGECGRLIEALFRQTKGRFGQFLRRLAKLLLLQAFRCFFEG